MNDWAWSLLSAVIGLIIVWVALVIILWLKRPDDMTLRDIMRLLPDVVRLVRRLAADITLPRGVRARLWLLLGYLLSPIDLVPDFIPILGWADDAIIVVLVLRSTVRHAGAAAVTRHWPGSADGLIALQRLTGGLK
ncbi:YkvA family protein [Demequina aurantiaca]|uniref:YkvA family protein n=1 Tax=Demequina aurantiaca TaxID=676200 RepID=UPI000781C0BF|nr:YkvA family protein [Demequina aurantiaca]